jgi:beta-mannosidase
MRIISLNGKWEMRKTGENKWHKARVPGSVLTDLLRERSIGDPFYRDNEDKTLEYLRSDYEYRKKINISPVVLKKDKIRLSCDGLDTLAEIRINGEFVGKTDNMHIGYEFDVKKFLKAGINVINIKFSSPIHFIENMHKKKPIWNELQDDVVMPGFYHIRKAHCMFGWDWGPKIPDSGIWRNINLKVLESARIDDMYVSQKHQKDKVELKIKVCLESWIKEELELDVSLVSPGGDTLRKIIKIGHMGKNYNAVFIIENPELWWPNGYGKQQLYGVEVNLRNKDSLLDSKSIKVGLRTLNVRQKKDKWGESFEFVVNGVAVFARGANYIIEDSLMTGYSAERTEKLIKDCVEANFNLIRVWGGGIYPDDYFFESCDRHGIIVWQDFMFACASYPGDDKFIKSVKNELVYNIKRIRNHPCIALWCGNNEIEWILEKMRGSNKGKRRGKSGQITRSEVNRITGMYSYMFEEVIPEVVKKYDPGRLYWPSSPSSGGAFDNPNDEDRGDAHYWEVWHGAKSFSDYRNHYFRFTSEYGFQSFPGIKTIKSFTVPGDRNILSRVMEKHQKDKKAMGRIVAYLDETFGYPEDFELFLYASQILQAEAIKCGVEHWRRNRGRCMGSLYWQLNDCWPAVSWSSIDYYGRWKALHYYAKRFYNPVLISADDYEKKVDIYVTNDNMENNNGSVVCRLRDNMSKVIWEGSRDAIIPSLKAKRCMRINLDDIKNEQDLRNIYLEFFFKTDGDYITGGTLLFVKPKHFNFLDPMIKASISRGDRQFVITLESRTFAKSVALDLKKMDCRFSDNYFDLSAGEVKKVFIDDSGLSDKVDIDEIKKQLQIRSLYDIRRK